jgi:cell division protein ZapD
VITEIEQGIAALSQTVGKAGQLLADNEWLTSIRSRAIIPGGTCEFDLPAYYAWQHRDADDRRADILKWARPLASLRMGAGIVLRLLRESGQSGRSLRPVAAISRCCLAAATSSCRCTWTNRCWPSSPR